MGLDIAKLRKLVALDENDSLSRFALGQALFQDGSVESLSEAAEHLIFANTTAPEHLATYHVLGQVLIRLDRISEARSVLTAGILPPGSRQRGYRSVSCFCRSSCLFPSGPTATVTAQRYERTVSVVRAKFTSFSLERRDRGCLV